MCVCATPRWLDAPCTGDEQHAWHCTDAFVEHPGWPWTCDKMTGVHGGTDSPTCGRSFTISQLQIGSGGLSSAQLGVGGAAAIGLAALAYYVYQRRRGGGAGDDDEEDGDREMLAAREDGQLVLNLKNNKLTSDGEAKLASINCDALKVVTHSVSARPPSAAPSAESYEA